MDEIDRSILDLLQDDGRAPYTDIAEELGVSEGTVRNRVERMVEDGTIERFTVEVGGEHEIEAFVMAEVSTAADMQGVVESVAGDMDVYELAGDQDLLVRLSRKSAEEVNEAVDSIRDIDGVDSTHTYMVLAKHR